MKQADMKKETMMMSISRERKLIKESGKLLRKNLYALVSEFDGAIYAYHCSSCGGSWKIYQNPYHHRECKNINPSCPPSKALKKASKK